MEMEDASVPVVMGRKIGKPVVGIARWSLAGLALGRRSGCGRGFFASYRTARDDLCS